MGTTYEKLGDYRQAIDYARQHLAIARDIGDRAGEGEGLRALGVALWREGLTQDAKNHLHSALQLFQTLKTRDSEAETLKNLAELYQGLGEENSAREYCQQALALATELGIPLAEECKTLQQELEPTPASSEGI